MTAAKKAPKKALAVVPSKKPEPKSATGSKMKPGKGSSRVNTRAVLIYGPAKTRKTGCLARLIKTMRVKLIAADPNCLPTLTVLNALPAAEDIYEPRSVYDMYEILEDALKVAEDAELEGVNPKEALAFDAFIFDSITSLFDWHKQDIAKSTGQRFMGDDAKNNGWNQFNSEFGRLLDLIIALSKYVHVICIAHSKDREPGGEALKKTAWAALALSPEVSVKTARVFNWILFKTFGEAIDDGSKELVEDEFLEKVVSRGKTTWYESILHSRPFGTFMATANFSEANSDRSEWGGNDLLAIFEAEGLVETA